MGVGLTFAWWFSVSWSDDRGWWASAYRSGADWCRVNWWSLGVDCGLFVVVVLRGGGMA